MQIGICKSLLIFVMTLLNRFIADIGAMCLSKISPEIITKFGFSLIRVGKNMLSIKYAWSSINECRILIFLNASLMYVKFL